MKCPKCQHFNDVAAKFCEECAAPLARTCVSCGHPLPQTAKFCPECAHPTGVSTSAASSFGAPETYTPRHLAWKILNARTALEGERKQVTVLFADLKASMELLAERDPEEARKLLDPVLELMMEAVHHYEGTVSQVAGDGITALFGAPLAHEDHAVRACYAALRMQERVKRHAEGMFNSHGVNLQIRVGLNSGDVVVRAIGSDLQMDYSAIGRTTHLAARMEQLASPGSILLTPSTLEMVEGYITVRPLGPVPVKGLADAVDVYEVTGAGSVRTRLQAAARRGLTRFVGRDAELEHLRRAGQLAGDGHGQVVALVAEAGSGKSRLLYEFVRSRNLQGWLILECAAVSYGKTTSYLPVINLLKDYFDIHDRDDHEAIGDKVTRKVIGLDRALEPTLPALLALLDVPAHDPAWQALEPAQRRRRSLDAVKRLLLREAREQPLLVIFEDLHWIDGETQAVLDGLVESLGSARLLLLVTYRPEYQHGWSSKTCYGQMRLDALPVESTRELLDALLGKDPALEPLKQRLVRRGNPFFLEETVRTLVETKALAGERTQYRLTRPVQEIQVPATVQAILAARIDRLATEDKRLLQTASVIGKDVPFALLKAVGDVSDEVLRGGLDRLQSAEFLYEMGLFPDLEYSFKHALTHDVTYGGLLQDRRQALHARIVDAIETLHPDRLDEQAERLAYHAGTAELWDKAAHYSREAGRTAFARSANQDAASHFEQAVSALDRLPESRDVLERAVDVRLDLRNALQVSRNLERQQVILADTLKRAEVLGDQRRIGRALSYAALLSALTARYNEALDLGSRALAIAETNGDLGLQVGTTNYLAMARFGLGDYAEAERLFEDVIARIPPEQIDERFGLTRIAVSFARGFLAVTLAYLGRFDAARAHANEAVRIAETAHHIYSIASETHCLGIVELLKGNAAAALEALNRSDEAWQMLQTPPWSGLTCVLGVAYCQVGELPRGLSLLELATEQAPAAFTYPTLAAQAEGYLLGGQRQDALERAQEALDHARRTGARGAEAVALRLVAEALAGDGSLDPEAATRYYRKAIALAEPRGMRPLIAHCYLGLGKLYQRTANREQAREHLTTATSMYREMDMRFYLEQAEAESSLVA